MAVVFDRANNPLWPLPADYAPHHPTDRRAVLTKEGQRLARVNAASLGGRPDLAAAGWHFFRETYLIPAGNSWYRNDYYPSPDSHYQWIMDWHSHNLLVHAAPRGTCKTTINLEDILRSLVTRKYWECALFVSTQKFAGFRLGSLMNQIEHNRLIIDDFGALKPGRGSGIWNRGSCMELTNGCRIEAIPITGASLGTRPSGLLVLDDVEKGDDLVLTPSDLREAFQKFFFNSVAPMARSPGKRIPIRVIGTLYNRRMFIYWLYSTSDSRVTTFWHRKLMNIIDLDWDAMGTAWQEEEKIRLGAAGYAAQCMNDPGTEAARILRIHPELTTYWRENLDVEADEDPLNSQALVVSHNLLGYEKGEKEDAEPIPIPQKIVRTWGDVVSGMRRFITVDSARTTTASSDFSVVHVLGFENTEEHRGTLWSLDCWRGRKRYADVIKIVYQMALKWNVNFIGAEAYPIQSEFYEMCRDLLPELYGSGELMPRIIPLKFPSKITKADKFMGMEWRFNHFRVKLPLDRRFENPAYTRLWYEIENFTEDLALLDHDDVLDTLAMHQAIGKQHRSTGPDIAKPLDIIEKLKDGEVEDCGIPLMSGINASDIPPDVLDDLLTKNYEDRLEEAGESSEWLNDPNLYAVYS